jgi:hypothetical protein
MSKKYSQRQVSKIIAKAMKRIIGKNPIQDVLDPDNIVEASDKKIPVSRVGVMYKSKNDKLKSFLEKKKNKRKD